MIDILINDGHDPTIIDCLSTPRQVAGLLTEKGNRVASRGRGASHQNFQEAGRLANS